MNKLVDSISINQDCHSCKLRAYDNCVGCTRVNAVQERQKKWQYQGGSIKQLKLGIDKSV